MVVVSLEDFRVKFAPCIDRLYARANAAKWQLTVSSFAESLMESTVKAFGDDVTSRRREVESYLTSLHVADLALARACRTGSGAAWEYFVEYFRPLLRSAAGGISRDAGVAREMGDSLYAELYGIRERDGERRSLLEHFHGRSSLATWLRSVLAQRYVDHLRQQRRSEPLNERVAACVPAPGDDGGTPDPDRSRYLECVRKAFTLSLASLDSESRLRLSYYYLRSLKLEEIAEIFGEHASTSSRKLERIRRKLRQDVERCLRREHKMDGDQVRLSFEYAVEALDVGTALLELT